MTDTLVLNCATRHTYKHELSNEKGDPHEFIDYNSTNGEHRSVYQRFIKLSNKQVPTMRWTFKLARRFK